MADYHVGCGLAGIYAGTLQNPNKWRNKSDVTDEAICAVRDYMVQECLGGLGCSNTANGGYSWTLKDGRTVELRVHILDAPKEEK